MKLFFYTCTNQTLTDCPWFIHFSRIESWRFFKKTFFSLCSTSSPWERMEWEWEGQGATKQPNETSVESGTNRCCVKSVKSAHWDKRFSSPEPYLLIHGQMRKKRMEADHETTSHWNLVTLDVSMWSDVWPPLKPAPLPGVGIRAQTTADQMTDYAQTRCFTFSLYSNVLLWPTFTAQLFLPEGASLCESKNKKKSSAALQENKTKTIIHLFTASQNFLLSFLLRRHYEKLVKKRNASTSATGALKKKQKNTELKKTILKAKEHFNFVASSPALSPLLIWTPRTNTASGAALFSGHLDWTYLSLRDEALLLFLPPKAGSVDFQELFYKDCNIRAEPVPSWSDRTQTVKSSSFIISSVVAAGCAQSCIICTKTIE